MYKGKEVCQGCQKSGTEVPRDFKNKLCYKCEKELNKGRVLENESKIEYRLVFQHHHAYRGGLLNDLMHTFLAALHNEFATDTGSTVHIRQCFGGNGKYYKVDNRLIEPLGNLFTKMETLFKDIENREKDLPNKASIEVQKIKDKIFNDGIEQGKNILFQLNSGELSMSDFDKSLTYKGR